jgi:hypothetical protein
MSLVVFIYSAPGERWPFLFIIFLWALALIYHGLKINGINPFRKGGKDAAILQVIMRVVGG